VRCGTPVLVLQRNTAEAEDAAVLLEDEHSEILPCGWQQLQFLKNHFYYVPVSIFDTVCNYTGWSRKVTPSEIYKKHCIKSCYQGQHFALNSAGKQQEILLFGTKNSTAFSH